MKTSKHLKSIVFGIFLGAAYAIFVNPSEIIEIVTISFFGVLVPNIDIDFYTRLSKNFENIFTNLFLIPFLIMLIVPAIYVTAFFVGYYGHVLSDLDKKGNWDFAKQRAIIGFLWIASIFFIMSVFNLNFTQTMSLFG